MSINYVACVGRKYDPEPSEPVMNSLFQQYERVLVESLVTSFGLDFLIKDQYGGDVDTIHNVRQIGHDEQMTYKNVLNQQDYDERGAYDSSVYHKDPRYLEKNRTISEQRKNGALTDAYTGEHIPRNGKSDLDHVIAAKEIHDDRGRTLAGLKGTDLANCEENLQVTNPHTNRTKKADSMEEFLSKRGNEYTEAQQANMRRLDATARRSYEAKLEKAYYTSPRFAKDLTLAAGNIGLRMGVRQAAGFVFAEMWFAVKEEFQKIQDTEFHLGAFLKAVGNGLQRGFIRAKEKYQELFSRFLGGSVAGVISNLTTTLCNIFFTTAKNVSRIIRQAYASLVEAGKVLFINPENYPFGERMRAVAKILATGASIIVGVVVSETIGNTGIKMIPVLGDIVPSFCGAFISGIMSCTLLYFLDRSKLMNKLFHALDGMHFIEKEIDYYRRQADYFEQYAAELEKLDLDQLQKETAFYGHITESLEAAKTEQELNNALKKALETANILIPWRGFESFDQFMSDRNSRLVFE